MICTISPYSPGKAPSERFRISAYLKGRNVQGSPVRFYDFYSKDRTLFNQKRYRLWIPVLDIFWGILKRVGIVIKLSSYDRILLHREAVPFGPPIFEWFIFKILQKKVIYDFDDAIWLPDKPNENIFLKFLKCRWKIPYLIRNSQIVIAGNAYLLQYAKQFNPNSLVIPTVVDTNKYLPLAKTKDQTEPIVIGWTGSSSTMKYLEPLFALIEELCLSRNLIFKIISDQAPAYTSYKFIFQPWSKESEVEDLQNVDIGIMPLTDDPWSRGKCGFKAIQFMALAIPVLVSPVGVNTEIVTHGVEGFHCTSIEDFKQKLIQLIRSEKLRKEMGVKGREKIIRDYSLESAKGAFLSLFER